MSGIYAGGWYVSAPRKAKASKGKWRTSDAATSAANRSTAKPKGKPKSKRTSKKRNPKQAEVRAIKLVANESGDALAREIALAERKARYEELVRQERLAKVGEYL
jgi:hypothetical protein